MNTVHHKATRRAILEILYDAYLEDPLRMVEPEPFYLHPSIDRKTIVPNMHYLYDRKLVEMMMGYTPPMFSAVRITAAGVDLVEDRYTFNLQFPPEPEAGGIGETAIPYLVEQLIAQGDLSPLDGWVRRQLLGDIQYLRNELSQSKDHWRPEVIGALLDWITLRHEASGGALSAVVHLRTAVGTGAEPTQH
tara:strand:+ start:311 stop:883 length:573 start_codon:yes stop_codon:yes gene_type:complete